MALGHRQIVFFLSPVLDYFVIDDDYSIKLLVHQDDTAKSNHKLTFIPPANDLFNFHVQLVTRHAGRAAPVGVHLWSAQHQRRILQKVFLDLLTPEAIAHNEGKIPSGDFALKIYGSYEFLVRDVPIEACGKLNLGIAERAAAADLSPSASMSASGISTNTVAHEHNRNADHGIASWGKGEATSFS
ncbi:hypothetical protein niasHS_016788 [Heterodera schachtii]|uniref:Uncharacterized protein n=1 Tax=Heterodera schachtii TaxID=97005 RepID=A0ABD2HN85_HETSC